LLVGHLGSKITPSTNIEQFHSTGIYVTEDDEIVSFAPAVCPKVDYIVMDGCMHTQECPDDAGRNATFVTLPAELTAPLVAIGALGPACVGINLDVPAGTPVPVATTPAPVGHTSS
jgi:hypothetical protein